MQVKMKKLAIMLLVGCLMLVAISSVSAAIPVEVSNYTALNGNVSAGHDVILKNNITDGTYGYGINVNQNVTVDGNGYCIDANFTGRIFKITNSSAVLTLKNITLKNAKVEQATGGAIFSSDGININIIVNGNVYFINNTADSGGAIYSEGLVNITSNNGTVIFKNNNATSGSGGAIYAGGDVIVVSCGDVCFINNTAGNGGAIYSRTGLVNITSTNGTVIFKNNKASGYGGAICVGEDGDDVFVVSCGDVCFINNTAGNGGAIYSRTGLVNITSTNGTVIFKNNKASGSGGAIIADGDVIVVSCGDVCFINNTATFYGGAIYSDEGKVNITSRNGDVTFENNNVTRGSGGAIYAGGDVIVVSCGDVCFINNTAWFGGAIYSHLGLVNITSNNGTVIFKNNKASGYGGAIIADGDVIVVSCGDVCFINNTAKIYGGAIYSRTGLVNITNAVFYGNNATNGTAIVLKNWINSNLTHCFWGLNYKNKTSIINAGLIATLDDGDEINGTVAPDNWILLNLTAPNTVATGINNTFELKFNILTDGIQNSTYNDFNSTMIVKLNCINGTVPEYVIAGKSFNYASNKVGADTINVINRYSGEIITNVSFNVIEGKKTPTVNITADLSNVTAGGNITIKLPSDATGTVNVTVNGTLYSNKVLVNGSVVINISNLTAGSYNVVVKYSGDGNYTEYLNSTFINIPKVTEYTINVTGKLNSSTIGGNINITLPVDANGNITIIVNDTSYNSTVVNGKVLFTNVPGLIAGYNTITVIYFNDNKYNDTNRDITFNVLSDKKTPTVNVTGELNNTTAGGYITIKFPADATGIVNVTVNGTVYKNYTLVDGSVVISIGNLTVGVYNVTVKYSGDNNYTEYLNSTFINIPIVEDYNITASGELNNTGKGGIITIDFPSDATGNVTIFINGQTIEETIVAGQIITNVTNLNVGENNITVIYSGDNKYNSTNRNLTINVPKVTEYDINVTGELNVGSEGGVITVDFPEDATGNVTIFINGETIEETIKDGQVIADITNLTVGENNITVVYSGDSKYNGTNRNLTFNVGKIEEFDIDVSAKLNNDTSGGVVVIELPSDATGNVTVVVNEESFDEELIDGKVIIDVTDIKVGINLISVSYSGDSKYNSTSKEFVINIPMVEDYNVTVSGELNVGSEGGVITVDFPEDATGNVTVIVNGVEYTVEITEGQAFIDVIDLVAGDNNITVVYSGDSKYNGTNRNLTFNVGKVTEYDINVSGELNVGSEGGVITVDFPEDATGIVTVIVNGVEYTVEITEGQAFIDVIDLVAGDNNITVIYSGDSKYNGTNRNLTFNVPKVTEYDIDVSGELNVGSEGGVITVDFPEDATGNVTVIVNGVEYTVEITEGQAFIDVIDLVAGDNNITVIYSGDDKYNATKTNLTFNVGKIEEYDITVSGNITGNEGVVKVVVPSDATGNVTVTINGEDYIGSIIDGVAIVKIPKLTPGTYNVTTTYNGDSKYDSKIFTQEIKFEAGIQLVVDDLIMYYHDGSSLVAYLIDSTGTGIANKTITFQINGKVYSRITDGNGKVSLAINLDYGIYPVIVAYNDLVKNVTVTVYPTVFGENIVKIYHNDTQYYAYFCNSKGEVLVNTDVQFNINGVMYTRTTNASGVAKLNINLNPGTYVLTAINPTNGEMWSNNVTVISTIQGEDVTKMYHNDTKYRAQFFNSDGSVLVNKGVTFNINGVLYSKTTDKDGYAILPINLLPGNYTITAYNSVTKELASNHIEVKPILVGKDLTKVYGKNATYDVLAYDSQGNPLAGANITYNIHGVFYNKITDDNGVAHLDINLTPGEYIATAYYNGYATSNKITVLEA